ncbi:carotenoid isomerooxygenase isoform X2 [Agrilus planipennis]|uniref:Carotenoid isomerooxygenase isoform X2 n=1 Tax=Agrilus planipennis TaxID=224129 RepID=A0A7F5QYE0_AGRPL|nr:carotenoid isomerooxygenase isoform X2 [Agrilus planipennis]
MDPHYYTGCRSVILMHFIRYRIKDGNVTYQCRFIRSEAYKKNWEAKRIVFNEFGTQAVPDPCHNLLKRLTTFFNPERFLTDNSNISIYPFQDEIYSISETVYAHKINATTLECEERKDIRDIIPLVVHHSSHPHVAEDGTVYTSALSVGLLGTTHHIVCFNKPENGEKSMFDTARIVASVPAPWPLNPSYMHTFGISDNYFVMIQQPFSVSITGLVTALVVNRPTSSALRWYEKEQTIITLINRTTDQKEDFYTSSFFYLHIINQFEITDEYLVIDVCCYKNPDFVNCMFTENLLNAQMNPCFAKMARNKPQRFIVPLTKFKKQSFNKETQSSSGNLIHLDNSLCEAYLQRDGRIILSPEDLCGLSCETPQIYYKKYSGKPYRYFYAIGADVATENPGLIIKVDTVEKDCKTWCEKNCYPSEPIFFPRPNAQEEDDGVLMSSLLWGEEQWNKIGLIILDAKSLKELGRAEFTTPSPAPKCLHGWFIPD